MRGKEKFDRFIARFPHPRTPFFERPHVNRRRFFEVLGAGVTASMLGSPPASAAEMTSVPVTMKNTARHAIFILLAGAPSHTDTFDFKMIDGVTPAEFKPETISNIDWPTGLLPKLGQCLPDLAIARSVRSWALQHNLAQAWAQIGRSPAAVLGDIAPNIGSVVAIEKERERQPGQVFPTFLALNSNAAIGSGFLSAQFAPFRLTPSTAGLPNTVHNPNDAGRFSQRWDLLHALDDPLRYGSPIGRQGDDFNNFYEAARGLMYNPAVDQAFRFTAADSQRYGNNGFGNACLVANKVLGANQGTRFIQITLGGWDHHQGIYLPQNLPRLGKILDDGVSALLTDLKSSGLLNETLVVMMGEFGRTVGRLSGQSGRDHYLQQFCVFAGAGVKGGRTLGSTDAAGAQVKEFGWSREREMRNEDIEATIYSAMGINWTTTRYDDPFGRGFEYVPYAGEDLYGPINELWA